MIERTRNPLNTKNEGLLKEVHLVGDKTKRIQLMQRKMDDGRDAYFLLLEWTVLYKRKSI
jgi:hypothetical protein